MLRSSRSGTNSEHVTAWAAKYRDGEALPVCFCCYGKGEVTVLEPLIDPRVVDDEPGCGVFRRLTKPCPCCASTSEERAAAKRDTVPPPRASEVRRKR